MTISTPVRIILCGLRTSVGKPVAESLLPDYEGKQPLPRCSVNPQNDRHKSAQTRPTPAHTNHEHKVIHFVQSVEAGKAEIPQILAGEVPQPAEPNEVGTHDYSHPARIVLFGRGFSRSQAEEIRQCVRSPGQPIAWVVGDPAQAPVGVPPPGYAEKTAAAIKRVMDAWRDEGGVKDGFVQY